MNMRHPIFRPLLIGATLRDRIIACMGALLGIAFTGYVCRAVGLPIANLPLLVGRRAHRRDGQPGNSLVGLSVRVHAGGNQFFDARRRGMAVSSLSLEPLLSASSRANCRCSGTTDHPAGTGGR